MPEANDVLFLNGKKYKGIDYRNQRRGRLVALLPMGNKHERSYWKCQCDCGNVVVTCDFGKRAQSCGCLHKEMVARRSTKHGALIGVFSGRKTPAIYRTWRNCISRCYNPNNWKYNRYGGRGIQVCDRWREFAEFEKDMGPSYKPGLSIDRINNNGNYEPENCRWATRRQQSRNTSVNKRATIGGITKAMRDWCDEYGISFHAVGGRIKRGMSVEEAIISLKPENAAYR